MSSPSPYDATECLLDDVLRLYTERIPFCLRVWQVAVLSDWWDAVVRLEDRLGSVDLVASLRGAWEGNTGSL